MSNSKNGLGLEALLAGLGGKSAAELILATKKFIPLTEATDPAGSIAQLDEIKANLNAIEPKDLDAIIVAMIKRPKPGAWCEECQTTHHDEQGVDMALGAIGDHTTLMALLSVVFDKLREHVTQQEDPLTEFLRQRGYTRVEL